MKTPALALVDGNVRPIEQAKIPVSDNGYLLGDGVFETMRTKRDSSLFFPELHLKRAQNGLKKIFIDTEIYDDFIEYSQLLAKEATKQIGNDLYIRINISTGSGYDWGNKPKLVFTGIARSLPEENPLPLSCQTYRGFSERHALSDVKSLSYVRSAALRRKVRELAVDDLIIVNRENYVVEASMSNLIARKGNIIYAPGTESGALPGITRQLIIDRLIDKSIYKIEEKLSLETLLKSDEVLLTSSISGVRRVSKIEQTNYNLKILFQEISQSYERLLN